MCVYGYYILCYICSIYSIYIIYMYVSAISTANSQWMARSLISLIVVRTHHTAIYTMHIYYCCFSVHNAYVSIHPIGVSQFRYMFILIKWRKSLRHAKIFCNLYQRKIYNMTYHNNGSGKEKIALWMLMSFDCYYYRYAHTRTHVYIYVQFICYFHCLLLSLLFSLSSKSILQVTSITCHRNETHNKYVKMCDFISNGASLRKIEDNTVKRDKKKQQTHFNK